MKFSAHIKAQALRFARLFAAAFGAEVLALISSGKLTFDHAGVAALVALVPAAVEATVRQFAKVVPAAKP